MRLVVQHGRDITTYLTEAGLFDDDKGHTGRSEVLLRTTVDNIVLADVNRTTQDIRTHIGYQRYIAFLAVDLSEFVVVDLCAEDGVVGRNMEIVSVLRDLIICRDRVGAGSNFYCLTEAFGFLECFLRPYTGVQVRCFLLEHVKRNHTELERGTAAEEEYTVTFRYVEKFFHQRFGFVHNGLEILSTVRDFQYG